MIVDVDDLYHFARLDIFRVFEVERRRAADDPDSTEWVVKVQYDDNRPERTITTTSRYGLASAVNSLFVVLKKVEGDAARSN